MTVLEDAPMPAERALVRMGEALRVCESGAYLQTATRDESLATA